MHFLWLLANVDPYGATKKYLNRPTSASDNWFLVVALVAIVLLWMALYYWDKVRKKFTSRSDTPQMLFVELCKAHALSLSERSILMKAVDRVHLNRHPSQIFIDPDVLVRLASSGGVDGPNYGKLSRKIFGEEAAV